MRDFVLAFGIILGVAVLSTAATRIKEVVVLDTKSGEVVEQVTYNTTTKSKKPGSVKVIELKFSAANPFQKKVRSRHHRRHQRRRCCEAGDLAGKLGWNCKMTRDYYKLFFNLTTRTRQKYQGTGRFHSEHVHRTYQRVKKCVRQQLKSTVQKCCSYYVKKERRWSKG